MITLPTPVTMVDIATASSSKTPATCCADGEASATPIHVVVLGDEDGSDDDGGSNDPRDNNIIRGGESPSTPVPDREEGGTRRGGNSPDGENDEIDGASLSTFSEESEDGGDEEGGAASGGSPSDPDVLDAIQSPPDRMTARGCGRVARDSTKIPSLVHLPSCDGDENHAEEEATSPSQQAPSEASPVFSYTPRALPRSNSTPPPRPVIKRMSSYSIETSIPLNFQRRGSSRILPAPDARLLELARLPVRTEQQHVRLMSLSSTSSSFSTSSLLTPPSTPSDESSCNHSGFGGDPELIETRRVSFSNVQVREHKRTMGDNPSCSYGTPVTLDWASLQCEDVSLYQYETQRFVTGVDANGNAIRGGKFLGRPKSLRELHLNHFQRKGLLRLEGFTPEEIKAQKRATNRIRNQREMTRLLAMSPVLVEVEGLVESAGRRVQQVLKKKNNKNNDNIRDDDSISSKRTGSTWRPLRPFQKSTQTQTINDLLKIMDGDQSYGTVSTTRSMDNK
jgi:hypothetical protein